MVKNPPAMWETWVQSLGWEDPLGGGYGNPLQYSCLENPMDRGAWWATVHEVPKSGIRLNDYTQHIVMCIKTSCSFFITHVANKEAQFLYDGSVTKSTVTPIINACFKLLP